MTDEGADRLTPSFLSRSRRKVQLVSCHSELLVCGMRATGGLRKVNLVETAEWLNLTLPVDRGKTVTKRFMLSGLGLRLSEKQIPQLVENLESGDKAREVLETVALREAGALTN